MLNADDVTDNAEAEKYLGQTVQLSNGLYGKLIAIYLDKFETTAGLTKTIEVNVQGKCTYTAHYAELLPIGSYSRQWKFPDGTTGKVRLDFNLSESTVERIKPFLNQDDLSKSYSSIEEL